MHRRDSYEMNEHNEHKCIKCKEVFTFDENEAKWCECGTYSEKLVKCPICNTTNPVRYIDSPGLHINSDIKYYLYKTNKN